MGHHLVPNQIVYPPWLGDAAGSQRKPSQPSQPSQPSSILSSGPARPGDMDVVEQYWNSVIICAYIYIYKYTYTNIYIYTYIFIYIKIQIHIYIYI